MKNIPYFNFLNLLYQESKINLGEIVESLVEVILKNNSVWILGNGGSASTAEHFETDLSFIKKGKNFPKIRVTSLTSNSSLISAIANDIGYANVFAHQLFRKAESGDLCVLISASGNSENLVKAVSAAKEIGLKTIGLLGFDGGNLSKLVDSSIIVETELGKYGPVEDMHLAICHAVSELVGARLDSLKGSE